MPRQTHSPYFNVFQPIDGFFKLAVNLKTPPLQHDQRCRKLNLGLRENYIGLSYVKKKQTIKVVKRHLISEDDFMMGTLKNREK
jgi:hypothetical protein